MHVRFAACRRAAVALVGPALVCPALVCLSGCRWLAQTLEEAPAPRASSGLDLARLWEDGYGFNNPNAELISSGKKKTGDAPQKGKNPFYREPDKSTRSSASAKPEFRVEEPEFDFR